MPPKPKATTKSKRDPDVTPTSSPSKAKAKAASKKPATATAVAGEDGQMSLSAYFGVPGGSAAGAKDKGKGKGKEKEQEAVVKKVGKKRDEGKIVNGKDKGKAKAIAIGTSTAKPKAKKKPLDDEGVINIDSSDDDIMAIDDPSTKVTGYTNGAGPSSSQVRAGISQDMDVDPAEEGEVLSLNGLLGGSSGGTGDEKEDGVSANGATVKAESIKSGNDKEVENGNEDEDDDEIILLSRQTTPKPSLKRKSRSTSSSSLSPPPAKKLARPSTPPPKVGRNGDGDGDKKRSAPATPSTPGRMLKLTEPLNPSPKKNKGGSTVGVKAQANGESSSSGSTTTTAINPFLLPIKAKADPDADATLAADEPLTSISTNTPSTSSSASTTSNFDVDMFTFKPEEVDTSRWIGSGGGFGGGAKGKRLPYEFLVGVYLQVGGTRSRLAIIRVITNFIRTLIHHSPQDLLPTIYLLSNHLKPSYVPLELGVGFQILNKAVVEVSGASRETLKRLWDKWGDPGDVAFEAKSNVRTLVAPAPLAVHTLYAHLLKIAKIKGNGAGKIKGDIVKKLLVQTKGEEVRYLVRTLISHIRIGAVRLTLLAAMARAFCLTKPQSTPADKLSDSLHATAEELRVVRPPPVKGGAKGKGKAKEEPDEMREVLERKCLEGVAILRRVYVRHPNYEDILNALLEGGFDGIEERVPLSVGIPLSPMLGSITRSLNEVYTRLGNLPFTAEAKLDGQRVQLHARLDGPSGADDGGGRWVESKMGGQKVWVRLFSRHLEDMTEKYPDLLALVNIMVNRPPPDIPDPFPAASNLTVPSQSMLDLLATKQITSFVMDAEIVALDKDSGAFRTFQDLSNRAKKDVKVEDIKVIVGVFAFDLMLVNDQPLLNQPFSIRRHLMRTLFQPFHAQDDPTIARFTHVEAIDSTKPEDVQAFFEQVVSRKCEGLMVKLLESGEGLTGEDEEVDDDAEAGAGGKGKGKGGRKKPLPSTYEPDMRSQGWLKVKKDYLEGVGDTLDLVPIGAWWGMGRKAGWWSPILLAVYNPETGALEAACKCISGFTDAFYKNLSLKYPAEGKPEMARKGEPYVYVETGGLHPDVWFNPQEVWQIAAADITSSPVYTSGASYLGSERGVSLRFPRFLSIREDKGIEEATSAEQLADMYKQQIAAAPEKAVAAADEMEDVGEGGDE